MTRAERIAQKHGVSVKRAEKYLDIARNNEHLKLLICVAKLEDSHKGDPQKNRYRRSQKALGMKRKVPGLVTLAQKKATA